MYRVVYEYSQPGEVQCFSLNEAVTQYLKLADDPKAHHVNIIKTEERTMTLDEIANAAKDRPRAKQLTGEAPKDPVGPGPDQSEAKTEA